MEILLQDPFSRDAACDPGWKRHTETVKLDTAIIETDTCVLLDSGATFNFRPLSVKLTDSNPSVSQNGQPFTKIWTKPELKEPEYKNVRVHHNLCD